MLFGRRKNGLNPMPANLPKPKPPAAQAPEIPLIDHLRGENETLQRINRTLLDERLTSFPALLWALFEASGASNYLEMKFADDKGRELTIEVRKPGGKTSDELRKEAEARCAELSAELDRLETLRRMSHTHIDELGCIRGGALTDRIEDLVSWAKDWRDERDRLQDLLTEMKVPITEIFERRKTQGIEMNRLREKVKEAYRLIKQAEYRKPASDPTIPTHDESFPMSAGEMLDRETEFEFHRSAFLQTTVDLA